MEFEQRCGVSRAKSADLLGNDLGGCGKEVAGTAQSMGVTVDGREAHEFQEAVENGEYNDRLDSEEEI